MKLLLAILPLVHAGTNKTIAPTPGFERPNPPSPTAVDDDYVVGACSADVAFALIVSSAA